LTVTTAGIALSALGQEIFEKIVDLQHDRGALEHSLIGTLSPPLQRGTKIPDTAKSLIELNPLRKDRCWRNSLLNLQRSVTSICWQFASTSKRI